MGKIIGASLYQARKPNERAELEILKCKIDGRCPLLQEAGACQSGAFLEPYCRPYAQREKRTTHTKAARCYYDELKALETKIAELPKMPAYPPRHKHVCQIGDYVYWPYRYTQYLDDKLTLTVNPFMTDNYYIHAADFTPAFIIKAAMFRPQAMMGGEIKDYQARIPLMLFHLSVIMPEMWRELPESVRDRTLNPQPAAAVFTLGQLPPGRVRIGDQWGQWDGERFIIEEKVGNTCDISLWSSMHLPTNTPGNLLKTLTFETPDTITVTEISPELQTQVVPDYANMVRRWQM